MPGGVWTTGDVLDPSTRPGAYFNLVAQAISLIGEGQAGTVAIVGRSDWGPVDEFVELESEAQVVSAFGAGLSLAKLARQAIRGGADTVKLMRIAGATEATAVVTLDDAVPVPALDISARYSGSRANNFTVTVAANPISGTDLKLFESGVLLETFTTLAGENDEFVVAINATDGTGSQFITAALNGAADRVVAAIADAALGGGDSGGAVVAGDYTAAQAIVLQESFEVFVQDDEDDTAIQDSLAAWAEDARTDGSRFITAMGSAAAETLTNAVGRAESVDHEGVVYVFPGFTDVDGSVFTGQEAAARVAGLIAAAGISKSITYSKVTGGVSVETSLTNSEIKQAIEGGIVALVYNGVDVLAEKGINTLTTYSDAKPSSFSKIRTIAVLDAVQNGLHIGLQELIGQVNNDDDGRATILGAAQAFLDTLIQGRALKPGAFVELDPEFNQEGDSMFLRVAVTPLDSIEKIFVTVYVSA